MFSKILFFFLITLFSLHSGAQVYVPPIKLILENEIKTVYLKKLEEALGDCVSDNTNCIIQKNDYMTATFPNGEICLPYTMCGFYLCMENKYRCQDVGVNYFTELALLTCNQYVKNIEQNKFSKDGVEWIYSVMVCLQKGLIDECEIEGNCQRSDPKKTCDHITEFTLSYHPGCYIKSGVGVCHLPLKDKIAIWKTVSPFMTEREKREAYKVIFNCITSQ